MMIKEYKHLIKLLHIHMVLILLWYVRMKWNINYKKKKKCILQRKKMSNIDLKALRDKSLLLRNEAQSLRTNSLLLRVKS